MSEGDDDPHEAEEGGQDAPDAPADSGSSSAGDFVATDGGEPPRDPESAAALGSQPDLPDRSLKEQVAELMRRYPQARSASIPALHAIQKRDGWCTPEGIREAAEVMDVEPAYLESVASFYDLFALEPVGTHRVLVCTNISCWMRGADELLESFCAAAGVDHGQAGHGGASSEDGEIFLSGFECLGACDIAPMASVDGRYYGPLTDADAAAIVEQLRGGEPVMPDKAIARRPAAGGPDGDPDPRIAADS